MELSYIWLCHVGHDPFMCLCRDILLSCRWVVMGLGKEGKMAGAQISLYSNIWKLK